MPAQVPGETLPSMFTASAHQFATPIVREIPRPAPDPRGAGDAW
jgi:hypothetical protein